MLKINGAPQRINRSNLPAKSPSRLVSGLKMTFFTTSDILKIVVLFWNDNIDLKIIKQTNKFNCFKYQRSKVQNIFNRQSNIFIDLSLIIYLFFDLILHLFIF